MVKPSSIEISASNEDSVKGYYRYPDEEFPSDLLLLMNVYRIELNC